LRISQFDKTKKKDHAIAEVYISANKTLVDEKEALARVDAIMKKYEIGDPNIEEKFKNAIDTCMEEG